MIEIDSFLRASDGTLVRASSCNTVPPNPDYVEGAIRLSICSREIIGLAEWDYVADLWCYIADMMPRLQFSGYAETYFPDQPIKLSFRADESRVLVTAEIGKEIRKASAPSDEFLAAVRSAGLAFFDDLSRLLPHDSKDVARQALSS